MSRRLKRVFGIDNETCSACGEAMCIIACIEDPVVIEKILARFDVKTAASLVFPAATVSGAARDLHVLRPGDR